MEKLTGEDNHIVKVGNNLYTSMISKPAIVRRAQIQNIVSKFEIKRPATYNNLVYVCVCVSVYVGMYIHRLLYQSFMVTTH